MKLTLMFPNRGKPPEEQVGYVRDSGNPYVFRAIWLPCIARDDIKICKGCPQSIISHHCTFYNKEVDQNVCNQCGGIEAATKRQSSNDSATEIPSTGLLAKLGLHAESKLSTMPVQSIGDEEIDKSSKLQEGEIDVVV